MTFPAVLARLSFNVVLLTSLVLCSLFCYLLKLLSCVLSPTRLQELALFSSKVAFGLPIHLSPWIKLKGAPNSLQASKQLSKMIESGKRPVFLLGNHQSFFDTLLTVHLLSWKTLMRTRTYMKADLFKMPFLSTVCKACGHFPVWFTSSEATNFSADKQKMEEIQPLVDRHLSSGGLLAFFPEGRMNPNPDNLDSFRYGGFAKALSCDASIWLVAMVGNSRTWPMQALVGGFPSDIRYDFSCYAPEGAKTKVKELRRELGTEAKETSDVQLIADDCRKVLQKMYDDAKLNRYDTKPSKRQRPFLELCLDLACFTTLPFLCYTLRDRPWDLIEFIGYIALTVIGIKTCKSTFHQIGLRLQTAERATKKRNLRKFRDQSWQLALHVIMTCFEMAIMVKTEWRFWDDGPTVFMQTEIDPWFRHLYLAQLAAWFYTAFSHRFLEAHHKDYFMMYGHHVVTILLLGLSFRPAMVVRGYLVLLAHDSSDISVDVLKMLNYLGLDSSSGWYLAEVVFALNLLSWISIRLWWFPAYMVWGTVVDGPVCCTDSTGTITNWPDYFRMRASTVLLWVLVLMHIWWFGLFLRLAVRLLSAAPTHQAGAEEYEGTSDSDVDRPILVAQTGTNDGDLLDLVPKETETTNADVAVTKKTD